MGVYTFGYGDDTNAKIMSQISGVGAGGHYYYIKRKTDVEEFLVMALGGCVSVFIWDARVKILAVYGTISRIFATEEEEKNREWKIGAMLYGKEKQLIVEMEF